MLKRVEKRPEKRDFLFLLCRRMHHQIRKAAKARPTTPPTIPPIRTASGPESESAALSCWTTPLPATAVLVADDPSRSRTVVAARPMVVILPSARVTTWSGSGVVSMMRFPRSDSSSDRERDGRRIAVNDEGNGLSGVPVPVGEGGEEKKEETEGDANETPARKVAVDRSAELLLSPLRSANTGKPKDTGPWLVAEGSTSAESSMTDGARDSDRRREERGPDRGVTTCRRPPPGPNS